MKSRVDRLCRADAGDFCRGREAAAAHAHRHTPAAAACASKTMHRGPMDRRVAAAGIPAAEADIMCVAVAWPAMAVATASDTPVPRFRRRHVRAPGMRLSSRLTTAPRRVRITMRTRMPLVQEIASTAENSEDIAGKNTA
jgi:hypothetical protein